MENKLIEIYTDGACSNNPGIGGWGCVLIYNGSKKILSGGEQLTTNNRMELMSIIKGLQALKERCSVKVFSDSAYAVNAFNNNWITNWEKNNWKNSEKKEIKNIDLWKILIGLVGQHNVTFIKVKGHSDNELNNLCDKIARDEIVKIKNEN